MTRSQAFPYRHFPVGLLVCLASCSGSSSLQVSGQPQDPTPVVSGIARYRDVNANGTVDAGDELVVPFSTSIAVRDPSAAANVVAPVTGDSLGSGRTAVQGPRPNEITVLLGTGASLKTRRTHSGSTGMDQPSGVDVVASPLPDLLENPGNGVDAVSSSAIDVFPSFVRAATTGLEGVSTPTRAVVLADLDGNGTLDLAEGNFGPPDRVWLNGGGTFSDSGQRLGASRTLALAPMDFDRDGDLDLVAGNGRGEVDRLWENVDGAATYLSGQVFGTEDTRSLAVGDLDGDGDPDLLVGNAAGPNAAWENRQGLFVRVAPVGEDDTADPEAGEPGGTDTGLVLLADVDGDGFLDAYEGNAGAPDRIFLNDGEGGFGAASQNIGNETSAAAAFGDVDGDGDPDLVIAEAGGPVRVQSNAGGLFADTDQELVPGSTLRGLALSDVDGDTEQELVLVLASGLRVWDNDRTGRFRDTEESLSSLAATSVAIGDVDGDGDEELVTGNDGREKRVFRGSSSSAFGAIVYDVVDEPGVTSLAQLAHFFASEDLDGDGDLDLVTGEGSVYMNDGRGGWALSEDFSDFSLTGGLLDGTSAVALADLNQDGRIDILYKDPFVEAPAAGELLDLQICIHFNDPAVEGSFSSDPDTSISASYESLALADLDLDGDLDLAGTCGFDLGALIPTPDCFGSTGVFFNDGQGEFSDSGLSLSGSIQVSAGDLTGNGAPDLLSLSVGGATLHANNGSAAFSSGDAFTRALLQPTARLGDLDRDGDLDILLADNFSFAYLNEPGGFTPSPLGGLPQAFDGGLADADGDGDLDVFLADPVLLGINLLLNDGTGLSYSSVFTSPGITNAILVEDFNGDGAPDFVVKGVSSGTTYLSR